MEVETRVSVQAMRGKFEQKHEDSSNLFLLSPASKPSTSPGRVRASSMIITDKSSSGDRSPCEKPANSSADEEERCVSKTSTKLSPGNVSKTKSIFSEIVSPVLTGSKVTKALSSKKHSVESVVKNRKLSSEASESNEEDPMKTTPSRKFSETVSAETKPSVVRRIPVFKSSNGGPFSDDRTNVKNESTETSGGTPRKRDKFLGHIRSRSHGNFMIKPDASVEKNGSFSNNTEVLTKSENGNKDLFGIKLKQKSSDNLYGHRDSKCSSPFEGKQKIVANVVKNMKNKEKPKVLRKFSFSKIEKEIKNKKEKALPSKVNDVKIGKRSPSLAPCIAKMEAIAKSTVKERRSSISGSPAGTGTVSVAKAVADIALVRCSTRSSESSNNVVPSEEVSPPARPPRRRSATTGLSSHKKGMAPSPPGLSISQNLDRKESRSPQSELKSYLNVERKISQSIPSMYKSSDSFMSPHSSDISRESSPVLISPNSPLQEKHKSKSSSDVLDIGRIQSDEYCTCDEDKENKSVFETPSKNVRPEAEETQQQEAESLPAGPPPKKPPRTFAYDIYRSGKESKSDDDVRSKENGETSEKSEITSTPPGPIYAVPLKKKKNENRLTPKPPVRSNSDLSKRDLIKPSVAPKPRHILNKVKRSSVVDPLSCAEKGEEAAMTSEFQRQAHIRYSLRRPKKPPPAPPPNSESEGSNAVDFVSDTKTENLTKSHAALNQSVHSSDNDLGSGSNPHLMSPSRYSPTNSGDVINSRCTPDSIYQSVNSDDTEDGDMTVPSIRITSRSSYNLHVPTAFESNQPLSLGLCPSDASSELTGLYRKRSMSDETLYKGNKYEEEPIYAMPIFANSKGTRGHNRQRELHYMCSVLFTDEESDAGRDGVGSGRRNSRDGDTPDGNKVKPSIISAWKREFRQSCRQVQNKIKKTVNR